MDRDKIIKELLGAFDIDPEMEIRCSYGSTTINQILIDYDKEVKKAVGLADVSKCCLDPHNRR